MPRRQNSAAIVGRDREVDAIGAALEAAAAGEPTHLVIAGEAGIGKTRLAGEARRLAGERGMRVLDGAAADVRDGVPYGPIVEALRRLAGTLPPNELASIVGDAGPDLARLVPSLGSVVGGEDLADRVGPGSVRSRILEAVLGTLQRLARRSPVVVVVEDLHWADEATRDALAFLVRNLREDPVLLVMTVRTDDLHRRHPLLPWLAELLRSGRVQRLDLGRLRPGETAALAAGAAEDERLSATELAEIHERSDGNPFFIEELVMSGALRHGSSRLPPTLEGILVARIAAVPEAAQAVLRVAAVAGRRVEHDLLESVVELDERGVLEGLRAAIEHQLLVVESAPGEPDVYAFRHALLQEAVYDDLLPTERRHLHRTMAEIIERRAPGDGAAAAWHWSALASHWAAAREEVRAFTASVRAGRAAEAAFAFSDARRQYERALESWSLVPAPEEVAGMDRIELLVRAAQAAWLTGDTRRAVAWRREAVAAVDPAVDPVRAASLLEQLSRGLWNLGRSDEALAVSEQAVATVPVDPPTRERARVLAGHGQLLMLLDRPAESLAFCEEAIEIAITVGARDVEGHARNSRGLDLAAMWRCEEAVASLESALAIANEIRDADDIGRAYVNLVEMHVRCGDLESAARRVEEGMVVAARRGTLSTYGRFLRADGVTVATERGRWDEARDLMQDPFVHTTTTLQTRRYELARWAAFLVGSGSSDAARLVRELGDLLEGTPLESQFHGPYWYASGELSLWDGRPADALDTLLPALTALDGNPWRWAPIRIIRLAVRAAADLAEIARARRDAAAATAAVERAEGSAARFPSQVGERWPGGAIGAELRGEEATVAAELARARGGPASQAWSVACDAWRAADRPPLLAYTRWREAEARLSEGDRAGAAAALRDAHEIAARLGAVPLLSAVRALAARSRLDPTITDGAVDGEGVAAAPAATPPEDPFGLTDREREVVALVALGRTNRQIGAELFISESTAGVHVSNILGKLGVGTRTEAAAVAVRLGLTEPPR